MKIFFGALIAFLSHFTFAQEIKLLDLKNPESIKYTSDDIKVYVRNNNKDQQITLGFKLQYTSKKKNHPKMIEQTFDLKYGDEKLIVFPQKFKKLKLNEVRGWFDRWNKQSMWSSSIIFNLSTPKGEVELDSYGQLVLADINYYEYAVGWHGSHLFLDCGIGYKNRAKTQVEYEITLKENFSNEFHLNFVKSECPH
ncbi:MAG: hypothetical protein QE271_10505 [Bacteriovoracaceae bacterium]|nr:hypothetical protein [Bacteriovoracaceae bacterium]